MFANLLYTIALALLSPMILYRLIRHGRYRRGIAEKFFGLSSARARQMRGDSDCLWIHAVSVGEVNLLPGIVASLEKRRPTHHIVISTSTDTGYDLAVQRFGAARVFFCPLDFTWAVRRTLANLAPSQLVLAELELWPNLIRLARRRGCDVMVINGRLSQRSASRYQRAAVLTRRIFSSLSWVGCQDEASRDCFSACGTPLQRLQVTGSIKFDDAPDSRDTVDVQSRLQWSGIEPSHRVWMFGSTQPGEEAMALRIYGRLRQDHPQLRLILVPRHKERFDEAARLVTDAGLNVHRRSDAQPISGSMTGDTVILVDTIGELRHWWGVAEIATVGGSFVDRGGQNMLEPAGYGCAVSFGPDTRNFKSIAEGLIVQGGAVRVNDEAALEQFIQRCLTDRSAAESLGQAARRVVLSHRGATDRTIDALCSPDSQRRRAA